MKEEKSENIKTGSMRETNVFGDMIVSEEVYKNQRDDQEERVGRLNYLIEQSKIIINRYLCLLNTKSEGCISDLLDDEIMWLISEEHKSYSEANTIVDIAGFMLHVLNEELHEHKNNIAVA